MDYIIRNFDVERGQITVEYGGKWTYAVDLPIEDGAFPVGEKLEQIIQSMAPTWAVERENVLAQTPSNVEAIQALVQPYPVQPVDESALQSQAARAEEQLESDTTFITQIVNDILAAKGL
jgi:hypothetical protein